MNVIIPSRYYLRKPWLDGIKFLAISLVVIGHVMGLLTDNNFAGYDYLQGIVKSFNMPLFFVLSGYTSYKVIYLDGNIKNLMLYIWHTTQRLVLPAFIWGGGLWLLGITSFSIFGVYWFCDILFRLLIALALSSFLAKRFRKGKWKYLIFVIFCFAFGNRTAEFCSYVLIGVYLRTHIDLLQYNKFSVYLILFIVYVSTFFVTLGKDFYEPSYQFYQLFLTKDFYIVICRIIGATSISLLLMLLYNRYSRNYTIGCYFGTMSLGIYLIHGFILPILMQNNVIYNKSGGESLMYPLFIILMTFVLVAVSVVIIQCIRKSKYFSFLLLGEK